MATARQTDTGGLMVNCVSQGRAVPIAHAQVSVFLDNDAGNPVPVAALDTDISGRTAEVALFAPPLSYSLTPDAPKPYAPYHVRVDATGHQPLIVRDVQVLPGSLAIQACTLNPLSDTDTIENIVIPPHTLYHEFPAKIPEDMVKPLPPPTGYVVLDKVVVPEYVIVHDGAPTAWANQYWVSYRDYIKNVVSSEIYANWPRECLKANILAINSFTLNRVFTEWYRGQGKEFTITSSTAYDQAYKHGRNVFEEITQLVDELFTTYITKPDIRQPLLAQYNDGRRTNNPGWLNQWGSKDLADRGYDALSILRHYYGSSVYLQTASQVAGVPKSFGGQTLTMGSTGEAVRVIQSQLNTIANNFPAINKLAVDGVYGQATADAVRKFQQVFNLAQSGQVDFATWYKISYIYVAVTKMAELV